MSPDVGDVIAGKYRVERVLGTGGMGVVVAAVHEELEQRVALKVLRHEVIDDEDAVARFAREARAAARIRSEHVARVLDVTTTTSGAPVLVMELLEGCDLERLLQTRGPLATHVAVDLVLEACEGVAAAHAAGVVHRDLKPANLFLAERADGTTAVKVLDFGISKVVATPGATTRDAGVTGAAMILGSPFYMAPEQLASTRDADARADVWSLVVVLFELIAGTVPFDGATIPIVQTRILTAPTPSLAALRNDIPPDIDAVIRHGLEKRLTHRFANVTELARALAPFASLAGAQSIPRIMRLLGGAPSEAATSGPSSVPVFASTIRASSSRAVVGTVLLAATALAAIVFVSSSADRAAKVPAPSAAAASVTAFAPPPQSAMPSDAVFPVPVDAAAPLLVDHSRPRAKVPAAPSGTAGFGGRR